MVIIFYIPAIVLCKNTKAYDRGSAAGYRILVVLFWVAGGLTTGACVLACLRAGDARARSLVHSLF